MTVVVGPNGSGKSNVVDAIGWVLGAQAPSAVRSQKMDDVIFAGTAKRQALGRAEVSLTIDNSAGLLPIEFTEVTITRTLFRSGDSEYAINGVPCRLLDVQELLSDSGVGRQQHVIISQGQIDAVLNARPEERRLIVEEAAGVLKYRRRKEKAERRLASTEGNLTRLDDLLREVRRQLRPLEKQADAARRHQGLVDELRALRVHLAGRDVAPAAGPHRRPGAVVRPSSRPGSASCKSTLATLDAAGGGHRGRADGDGRPRPRRTRWGASTRCGSGHAGSSPCSSSGVEGVERERVATIDQGGGRLASRPRPPSSPRSSPSSKRRPPSSSRRRTARGRRVRPGRRTRRLRRGLGRRRGPSVWPCGRDPGRARRAARIGGAQHRRGRTGAEPRWTRRGAVPNGSPSELDRLRVESAAADEDAPQLAAAVEEATAQHLERAEAAEQATGVEPGRRR